MLVMGSQLSAEQRSELTPLLGSLARLIASHGAVAEAQLHMLLDATSLAAHPAALAELERWVRMLTRVRASPTPALRQTAVESLLHCGLPEAAVLLAVSLVADNGTPPLTTAPTPTPPLTAPTPPPAPLHASVTNLDFGVLAPGQTTTLEFAVHGGPGHVILENDYVQVAPPQFTAGTTRLRVGVRPLTSGLLWTKLKLVTPSATLELPIMAQWQDGGVPAKLLLDLISTPLPPTTSPLHPLPITTPPAGRVATTPPMPSPPFIPPPLSPMEALTPVRPTPIPPVSRRFNGRLFLLLSVSVLVVGTLLICIVLQSIKMQELQRQAAATTVKAIAIAQQSTSVAILQASPTALVAATTATEAQRRATVAAQNEFMTQQAATTTAIAILPPPPPTWEPTPTPIPVPPTDIPIFVPPPSAPPPPSTGNSVVLPNGGHLYRMPSREPGMAIGLIWPGDEVVRLSEEFENINGRWIYVRVVKASPNRGDICVPEGTEGYARATLISTP